MSLQIDVTTVAIVPALAGFAATYGANDQLGAANKIQDACANTKGTVRIESLVVIDIDKQKQPLDLFFFSENPVLVSADNAAFDVTDAEMLAKCRGVVSIVAGDYADSASNSIACKRGIELLVQSIAKSRDIYCVAVTRGTPTYSSVASLKIAIGMIQ